MNTPPNAAGAQAAMPANSVPFSSLPGVPFPGFSTALRGECLGGDAAPGPGTNPELSPAIARTKRGCRCGC